MANRIGKSCLAEEDHPALRLRSEIVQERAFSLLREISVTNISPHALAISRVKVNEGRGGCAVSGISLPAKLYEGDRIQGLTLACAPFQIEVETANGTDVYTDFYGAERTGSAAVNLHVRRKSPTSTQLALINALRDPVQIRNITVNGGNPGCAVNTPSAGQNVVLPGRGAELLIYVLRCEVISVIVETDHGASAFR